MRPHPVTKIAKRTLAAERKVTNIFTDTRTAFYSFQLGIKKKQLFQIKKKRNKYTMVYSKESHLNDSSGERTEGWKRIVNLEIEY